MRAKGDTYYTQGIWLIIPSSCDAMDMSGSFISLFNIYHCLAHMATCYVYGPLLLIIAAVSVCDWALLDSRLPYFQILLPTSAAVPYTLKLQSPYKCFPRNGDMKYLQFLLIARKIFSNIYISFLQLKIWLTLTELPNGISISQLLLYFFCNL